MTTELSLQTIAFADTFIDVPGLNAHVSQRLADRIADVKAKAHAGVRAPAKAFAVLGAAGGGKTHVFARLRHDAGLRATLVLLRPFFGVSLGPRDVLATMIDQLCVPVRGGSLTALDLLSAHWLAEPAAGELNAGAGAFPSAALEEIGRLSVAERAGRVDHAVETVLRCIPETEPAAHLVRAILNLGALDRSLRWAELAWLSGREPRREDAGPLSEADVAHLLRIVAVLASPVAPLMLTFDQLENLASDDDARVLAYGNLVAELVDTVPSLTIAQLALTSEWMQFIEPRLSLPQKTRVAGDTLLLESPDRAQREQLLRVWHTHLAPPNGRGGRRRFPSPLSEQDLEALLEGPGMTPRLLLAALSRAVAGKTAIAQPAAPPSLRPGLRYRAIWDEAYARTLAELKEKANDGVPIDAAELAEGIGAALAYATGLVLTTRNERERVLAEVRSPDGACSLVYATGVHHRSVGSTLARATDLAETGKAAIVRERRLAIPVTWSAVREAREAFECLPNARWLWLEEEDVARLLTLARLSSQARAGRLRVVGSEELFTSEDLRSAVREETRPETWRPATTIVGWLSDVPRERPTPAVVESSPASVPAVAPAAPSSPSLPSLGEWVRTGGQIGRAALQRYGGLLRALRSRRR